MAKSNSRVGRVWLARWRVAVQSVFLLAWLDPLRLRMHGLCAPVFHCYSCPLATFACPIGVLANFSALHMLPLIALGVLVVSGALFGSLICGWACPFGLLQDLLGKIPVRKFALPSWMSYGRYLVLAGLVLAVPWFYGEEHPLFFCRLCPAGAIEGALPNVADQAIHGQAVAWPSAVKISILVVFLGMAVSTWRPWCGVLCPLGAIYGLCNHFSLFYVRFNPDECNNCDLCRKMCRYRGRGERRGAQGRCVRCLECSGCDAITVGTVMGLPRDGMKQ